MMVLVTVACCILFLALYSKLHPGAEYAAAEFALFISGSMVEETQVHVAKLRTNTVRIFVCMFAASFVVLSYSYKGALTSTLSVKKLPPPFSDDQIE